MESLVNDITAFRQRWKLPAHALPHGFDPKVLALYQGFFHEELQAEASEALAPNHDGEFCENKSDGECFTIVSDAVVDAMVFIVHMSSIMGFAKILPDIWRLVYKSNNSKGEDGKLFQEDGKMIKGKSYFRANVKQFFDGNVTLLISGNPIGVGAILEAYERAAQKMGASTETVLDTTHNTAKRVRYVTLTIRSSYPWMYAAFRDEVGRHVPIYRDTDVNVSIALDQDTISDSLRLVRYYRLGPAGELVARIEGKGEVQWDDYCALPADVLNLSGLLGAIHLHNQCQLSKS